jgi:hypothetical protein
MPLAGPLFEHGLARGDAAQPERPEQQRHQPLRQQHDHQHEGHADDQLPCEGHVAAEVGRGHVDQHRANQRPPERAPPAQRDPDDQLGAQREPGEFRRHHAAEGAVAEARDAGDRRHGGQQHDLDHRRRNAQVGAARLVVADGGQHPPGVAAHQQPAQHAEQGQHAARHPVPGLDREIEALVAGQARAGACPLPARQQQLRQHDRQDQRDDGCEERRRAAIERQPAHQRPDRRTDHDGRAQRQQRRRGTEAAVREHQPGRIGADAEEGRLAEAQVARVAPEQVDRDRGNGEEEGLDEDVEQVGVEHPRPGDDQRQADAAQHRNPAARTQPCAQRRRRGSHCNAFSHAQTPSGECAA